MSEKAYLKEALANPTLASLRDLLEHSDIQISFWGVRVVTVEGYEGGIDLWYFSHHFAMLSGLSDYVVERNLTIPERTSAIKCSHILKNHYEKAEEIIFDKTILTKIFYLFREIFFLYDSEWIYGTYRHEIVHGYGTEMRLSSIPSNLSPAHVYGQDNRKELHQGEEFNIVNTLDSPISEDSGSSISE